MTSGNGGRRSRLESCKTKCFGQCDWAISKQTDEVMQRDLGWAIQRVEHSHIYRPTDDIQLTNKERDNMNPTTDTTNQHRRQGASAAPAQAKRVR